MRILNCLKNKNGFTLLECILAVGILSAVLASLVALQSSIIFVAQNSMNKLKAVWAMRQAAAQLNYVLDKGGFNSLSESASFVWPGDKRFNVEITKKNLNEVKPSQFLITALKFYNMTSSAGNEDLNVDLTMGPIAKLLDDAPVTKSSLNTGDATVSANQSFFANVFITVSWISGAEKGELKDGFFLIDNNSLAHIQLPDLGNEKNNSTQNTTGQNQ